MQVQLKLAIPKDLLANKGIRLKTVTEWDLPVMTGLEVLTI